MQEEGKTVMDQPGSRRHCRHPGWLASIGSKFVHHHLVVVCEFGKATRFKS